MTARPTFWLLLGAGFATAAAVYGILMRVCAWAGFLCPPSNHAACSVLGLIGLHDNVGILTSLLVAGLILPGAIHLSRSFVGVYRGLRAAASVRQGDGAASAQFREVQSRVGLDNRVVIVEHSGNAAFTFGLWRPKVYLSQDLVSQLSVVELEAVLLHEATHVRRRDPLRSAVGEVVSGLLWFVPVLRDLKRHLATQIEVEADLTVIQRLGRQPLASALYKLISAGMVATPQAATVGLFTADRVESLVQGSPSTSLKLEARHIILSSLSAMVMACLLVV